jgi:hypothetical protein
MTASVRIATSGDENRNAAGFFRTSVMCIMSETAVNSYSCLISTEVSIARNTLLFDVSSGVMWITEHIFRSGVVLESDQ